MRIQHNIAALNSHRQLSNNNSAVSKNLEKLSSGYRINRAGDDAAGLAISEKMRAQITGLDTAVKNANDGISLIQTAEGAMTEVHSMLNRMVELADQSANGTYQDSVDRENLQEELTALSKEIDRIADGTNFNGIKLLDGTMGSGKFALDANHALSVGSTVAGLTVSKLTGTSISKAVTFTIASGNFDGKTFTAGAAAGTGASIRIQTKDKDGNINVTYLKMEDILKDEKGNSMAAGSNIAVGSKATIDLSKVGIGKIEFTNGTAASVNALAILNTGGGLDGKSIKATNPVNPANPGGGSLTLQIGDTAESFNQLSVSVGDMHAAALGLGAIDIGSQSGAKDAVELIKTAINTVSSTRGTLGALQNRLEHTINNLSVTSENMTAAESRIRDVDMAKEMMTFTKNNILTQASQSMLAQANQLPQGVLQLLQ